MMSMNSNRCAIFIFLLLISFDVRSFANENDSLSLFENSPTPLKKRVHLLNYTVAGLYPTTMTWLYTQWYKDYPQTTFHFFNDNSEWLQMDKFGHFWDAYSIAKPLTHLYRWTGYSNKKSTYLACGIAFMFQTTVEVFDGFSSEWGFSTGDVMCNTGGVLLFGAQQLLWEEQRFTLKYSFSQSKYSRYRPNLLGSNLPENILKDYNGLTYWLCINPYSFMSKESKFPKWLNFAVGFGADGMTGGKENPSSVDGHPIPSFERRRQFYLALDVDLAKINTGSKFVNGFFKLINIVHIPAPAVEINSRGVVWRGLAF